VSDGVVKREGLSGSGGGEGAAQPAQSGDPTVVGTVATVNKSGRGRGTSRAPHNKPRLDNKPVKEPIYNGTSA
jgi:hypothetical protein